MPYPICKIIKNHVFADKSRPLKFKIFYLKGISAAKKIPLVEWSGVMNGHSIRKTYEIKDQKSKECWVSLSKINLILSTDSSRDLDFLKKGTIA